MEKYITVSFSGGKDSTAMLLRMIELGEQIDEIIYCDTYKEFPQMYVHIEKIKKFVEDKGIKFTTLRSKYSFDYWLFEYDPKRRDPEAFRAKYGDAKGKSWASAKARWCTGELKIKIIDRYLKDLRKDYEVIDCIGIAADEQKRIERENQKIGNKRFPLNEWGWTEQDALNYCYSLGYDWGGLYKIFERVSCWCCPLQSLEELRKLRKHFPDLWEELREMDRKTWRKFRSDYTVEELELRFQFEEQRIREGKSIRSRDFYAELKQILQRQDNGTD